MSNYKNRINKLIVKTHDFISYSNQCLAKDYFKARFDENEKPEDFEKRFNEVLDLKKKYYTTKDVETKARIEKILKEKKALFFMSLYQEAVELCEKHPNGVWQPKFFSDHFLKIINEAKKYFNNKKTKT